MSENFIPLYDLESLNEQQRQDYLKAVCKHLGIPDDLNLVALTHLDDGEGPSRLVAYIKRGGTENVRNNLQIDVTSLTSTVINGSIVFTATALSHKTGRQEISTGAKYIDGLKGVALDDGIMTAQTRALRRVTLQFVGAGVLDESEVHQGRTVSIHSAPTAQISLAAPQPTVQPSSEPGKDITLTAETPEEYAVRMGKLRVDAIASINGPVEVKKPRKTRTPKPKVDMGPSAPPTAAPVPSAVNVEAVLRSQSFATTKEEARAMVEGLKVESPAFVPDQFNPSQESKLPTPSKPRLSTEEVKPYRQRLFKLVNNHLEPNGFAPKEGIGNPDKMRNLAAIMFPDVASLAELTIEQWEKYLSTLEKKVETEGAKETIRYIEDSIGL